jgi:FlaA1/EpsC-like NDP-sugar epimerase
MIFLQRMNILPRWIIAFFDCLILLYAVVVGFILRYNFDLSPLFQAPAQKSILWFTGLGLLGMILTKSYMGIVRHTSLRDSLTLVKMTALVVMLMLNANAVSFYILDMGWIISLEVLVISSGIGLICMVFYRMLVRELFLYAKNRNRGITPVVVYGAGEAGILAQQIFAQEHQVKKRVVAFLDDDQNKTGKKISGANIYWGLESLAFVAKKHRIKELVISVQQLPVLRKREIIDECLQLGLQVSIIPPVREWINGTLQSSGIREVKIDDLLSRDVIGLDKQQVKKDLAGKVVLVTGAAGSIGSELVRQIMVCQPAKILLVDQAESSLYNLQVELNSIKTDVEIITFLGDVRKRKAMSQIIKKHKPQVIYHAAAYKHVPMMEAYPEEAISANILGTCNIADLAVMNHVEKFVMVSTDKAVNPSSVMGASKRIAEMYVQALNDAIADTGPNRTRFVTTRFGNVLGSNGSVIPLFKKQIQTGGPVTVTHPDITRYFMTIPEACQLVLEAGVMGEGGEIFAFDMGEPVKIVDLAKKMVQLSGKRVDRDIKLEYCGLRPGEKLFEELLSKKEELIETHHPKIMIAKVSKVPFESIVNKVEAFKKLLKKNSDVALVSHMKTIVPEYVSQESRFSFLDNLEVNK